MEVNTANSLVWNVTNTKIFEKKKVKKRLFVLRGLQAYELISELLFHCYQMHFALLPLFFWQLLAVTVWARQIALLFVVCNPN